MRIYPSNRPYKFGTYKRECDRCGWDYLNTELVKEQDTNLIVCRPCLDPVDNQKYKRNHPHRSTRRE